MKIRSLYKEYLVITSKGKVQFFNYEYETDDKELLKELKRVPYIVPFEIPADEPVSSASVTFDNTEDDTEQDKGQYIVNDEPKKKGRPAKEKE